MTTWDIQPSGGDYTSWNAMLGNASTVASDIGETSGDWTSTTDTAKATVADNSIIMRGKVSDQARNAGFDNGGTNHSLSTTANRSLEINNTGCTIDGAIIEQTSTTASNECIRVATTGLTTTVINSILHCPNNTSDQDGIYLGGIAGTVNTENCIVIGAGRAGFNAQQFSGSNTQTWNIISATIWNCGRFSGELDGGGVVSWAEAAGATNNHNVQNSLVVDSNTGDNDDFANAVDGSQSGTRTWNIDNSGCSDTSISTLDGGAVNALESLVVVEGNPASGEVGFTDTTSSPFNLTLFDDSADNAAQDRHATATGAGLTIGAYVTGTEDIAGTTRPVNTNYDLGAFEVSAGADSTLVAASGSYAWTGTAATLLHDSVMAAAGGSYAWTGQTADLVRAFVITAESGGYALTGTAATLLHDRVIAAASGSYALTGTAAGLLYDRIMAAAGGSYAWAGQDVTLLRSVAITAESVSYAWTGQTATLLFDALISAESASYAWAGQDVTLSHQTGAFLIADTGSYTLTGQDVGFLYDRVMVADSGGFLWTGTAANLIYSGAEVTGGAFYAEPDRKLEKRIRELRKETQIIETQVEDHLRAKEHAKPKERRKEPKFTMEAARNLAKERQDTALLVGELEKLNAVIESTAAELKSVRQEEDDAEALLFIL